MKQPALKLTAFYLKPCPDCGTNKFVHLTKSTCSRYARYFWHAVCRSDNCIAEWHPQKRFPKSTISCDSVKEAVTEWNKGNSFNDYFSFGGVYTGG